MAYSTASDLFSFGVPRGSTPNPGRVLASAEGSVCSLDQHGFVTGDAILFSPAGAGAMPAGLASATTYYAELLTEHTFAVRSTPGGAAITFTDADDPIMVVAPLDTASAIAWADALIDDMLPAHVVPITGSIPPIVRMTSAEMAAGKLLSISGAASVTLATTIDAAMKRLERWARGVPLRDPDAPAAAGLSAPALASRTDSRGWRRYGGRESC